MDCICKGHNVVVKETTASNYPCNPALLRRRMFSTSLKLSHQKTSTVVDRMVQWHVLQMTYIQATQGGGGWPMSCFLTPDLKPFLGGTYFPPQDAYGRPGFKTLLRRITEVWHKKKDDIKLQSSDSMQQLVDMSTSQGYSFNPSSMICFLLGKMKSMFSVQTPSFLWVCLFCIVHNKKTGPGLLTLWLQMMF